MIADIDRFKRVNDVYGHLAGDEVIKSVADALSSELAEIGMLARVGGEEFALLAQNQTAKQLEARLSRLRERMAEASGGARSSRARNDLGGRGDRRRGRELRTTLLRRRQALYAAKASGRNRVLFAHELGPLNPYIRDEPIAPAGRRSPKRA